MGSVNLDNTGSGSAITLSSNGTQLLLNGTAIGGGGSSTYTINNQTAAYTVVSGDLNAIINCSGATSFTVALTAAATLGAGFNCVIWNNTTTTAMTVTIDPNASETIDGVATLVLRQGEGTQIVCDGTNWQTGNKKTMRGYAENMSATDTRPVSSGASSIAIGRGTTASGTASVAIGYNSTAAGGASGSTIAILGTASPAYSTAIGLNSGGGTAQTVTGLGAMALGGSYAAGADSFAAAIASNSSSYGARQTGTVAFGTQSAASGLYSIAIGSTCTASGNYSLSVGLQASNSGYASFSMGATDGSYPSTVGSSAKYSIAFGAGAYVNTIGKLAFASGALIATSTYIQSLQTGFYCGLKAQTTNATPVVLTTDAGAASTSNQVILLDASAYTFSIFVVARQQAAGGTASASWQITGLIRRESGAANTVLVASTVTTISNVPAWTIAVSADTTNGGLAITATGAASTNIRWVATAQTSEVNYA